MTIAITGATGQVGKELVFLLQQKNLANRLLVRHPESAAFLLRPSSQIISFDFNRPETFPDALKNVESLFLVCDTSINQESIKTFLKAVKEAKIKKIVVMSGIGADKIKTHFLAKLETYVQETNIPHVALRANWFFQNFGSHFRKMIQEKHELAFPDGGAPISFVDARDIAEVAAHFLTTDFSSPVAYDITGPESLTHSFVAKLFSEYLPYKVVYKELSEQEAKEQLGWGEEWLRLFRDIRNGLTSPVSDAVKKILGKSPRRLKDYILENLSLWLPSF